MKLHPLHSGSETAGLPSKLLFADHIGPKEVYIFTGIKRSKATDPSPTGGLNSQRSTWQIVGAKPWTRKHYVCICGLVCVLAVCYCVLVCAVICWCMCADVWCVCLLLSMLKWHHAHTAWGGQNFLCLSVLAETGKSKNTVWTISFSPCLFSQQNLRGDLLETTYYHLLKR